MQAVLIREFTTLNASEATDNTGVDKVDLNKGTQQIEETGLPVDKGAVNDR